MSATPSTTTDRPGAATSPPRWERRFRAPSTTLPVWAEDAPDHLVHAANISGAWQVYAWDRATDVRRQVTEHPTGVRFGTPTPDGAAVVWFEDRRGDEIGRWMHQPFAGGPVEPLLPGVPAAWSAGLALGPGGLAALGTADRDGFVLRVGQVGGTSRVVARYEQSADVAGLTRDGVILVVEHAEHGDSLHPALRAYDLRTDEVLADLWDGEGNGVHLAAVSPVRGDERLAVLRDRSGRLLPAVWDPVAGTVTDLPVDLPGELHVADWWPDASALLVLHSNRGREELLRLPLDGGAPERLDHPDGSVSAASVRPDGQVWYRWSSGSHPSAVRAVGSDTPVLELPGTPAPTGVPYRDVEVTNPTGQQVHTLLAEPSGPRPHPLVLLVHGGPHAQDTDAFDPEVQAFVDHGCAVALVNYRGSTGYGKAWQDALQGDPGRPEVEDVTAARDQLVAEGVADPDRVVIAGASWGGYVTLQTIGTVPDGWRAALAVVPVADYESAYADESEGLQAFDRSLFGGSPADVPDLYRERSPITYAEQVRTPVLVMVGENDTRCPLQQVLNYTARLDELGRPYELDRFDAGHGALVLDERVRQMRVLLDFTLRHVPGLHTPEDDSPSTAPADGTSPVH